MHVFDSREEEEEEFTVGTFVVETEHTRLAAVAMVIGRRRPEAAVSQAMRVGPSQQPTVPGGSEHRLVSP